MQNSEKKQCQFEAMNGAITEMLSVILKNSRVEAFEYLIEEDRIVLYDKESGSVRSIPDYLFYVEENPHLFDEDRWKMKEFFQGKLRGPVEVRVTGPTGRRYRKLLDGARMRDRFNDQVVLVGSSRDITMEKSRQEQLEEQAKRDSLTGLYNHSTGKDLINDYLKYKDPYSSCGMIILDVDYFKNTNDTYGHLFGDRVLTEFAHLFQMFFEKKDILMRAGGDEFVILMKDISHGSLVKKVMLMMEEVRQLDFDEKGYSATCSVGVSFLPANTSGYTYDQLFSNADWALYRAKEQGRNRFVFCDTLKRFEENSHREMQSAPEIDTRYLHGDIISTAFEIFEKNSSFETALALLFRVLGIRFGLDRITVAQLDLQKNRMGLSFQWTPGAGLKTQDQKELFSKEDFLTLFHSYDEYGTAVLHYDQVNSYSSQARTLLFQENAKTVVFAAMYCEGKYMGDVSYVVCDQKRYWTKDNRSQLGEVTKIISAHLAKHLALNGMERGILSTPEYDSLTGLLSFTRFREEVERMIVGGNAGSYVVIYTDFAGFKYFNQKCGYNMGDQVLREFANHIMGTIRNENSVYFTRVVADQFILFMPFQEERKQIMENVHRTNEEFVQRQKQRCPGVQLKLRTGIYRISPDCVNASAAIDAANYARRQIRENDSFSVCFYDEKLERQQHLEHEIRNGLNSALEFQQMKVYFQPRVSLTDRSVIGAEALLRWERSDGSVLYPGDFVPLYERTGRILELDFYVLEKTAEFLEHCIREGKKVVPISINFSILHTSVEHTAEQFLEILQKHHIDPALIEVELTETATVTEYEKVRQLFKKLQEAGVRTALDDFGAGYSVLNMVLDVPLNTIKIDKCFLDNCFSSMKGHLFLKRLIPLLSGIGYHVVCEGVETEQQERFVRQTGCSEVQGNLFFEALTMKEFEEKMNP